MGGPIDVAVVVARAIVFLAALQAAGATLFSLTIRALPVRLDARVRRLVLVASVLVVAAVAVRGALEPARMAGSVSGVLDAFLWSLFLGSDAAVAQGLRLVGAGVLVAATVSRRPGVRIAQWLGVGLIVVSFAAMGHTRSHDSTVLLGGLLAVHIAAAAFWLGALLPLLVVVRLGTAEESARVLAAFSALAVRVVAGLFAAGLLLAGLLLGSAAALVTPYGRLLTFKLVLFVLLLGVAAANRYRWVPRLGATGSRAWLQRSIAAELLLMLGVLGVTAAMTTLYSPH